MDGEDGGGEVTQDRVREEDRIKTGTLATVGDWSQLQPLQCGYPASPPSVGNYLTVADPLPTPSPGQGYYYVTAVNYQGQTRYGRQRTSGVLSGRDPGVLPGNRERVVATLLGCPARPSSHVPFTAPVMLLSANESYKRRVVSEFVPCTIDSHPVPD